MKLNVRLIRSTIGTLPNQRATVRSLGLRKIGSSAEHEDTPAIRGMIKTVAHLVSVNGEPQVQRKKKGKKG